MDIAEKWLAVPGYVGAYEVSSLGRVRSLNRITDRGRRWRGRLMTPSVMDNGYHTVTLWRNGAQKSALVHRLVLSAFVGTPPEGHEGLHRDGNRSNNRLENLSWGTHSENQFDQVAHGTHPNAAKTHCPLGHPFTPENTYSYPNKKHRACRICRREYARRNALKEKVSA
jgi:hypothetical protein